VFFIPDIFIGYPALVSKETGTRFGSVLAEALINRAWYQDFEKIIKRVSILFVKQGDQISGVPGFI